MGADQEQPSRNDVTSERICGARQKTLLKIETRGAGIGNTTAIMRVGQAAVQSGSFDGEGSRRSRDAILCDGVVPAMAVKIAAGAPFSST